MYIDLLPDSENLVHLAKVVIEGLDSADYEDYVDDRIKGTYGPVNIGDFTYDASDVLKKIDPVAYQELTDDYLAPIRKEKIRRLIIAVENEYLSKKDEIIYEELCEKIKYFIKGDIS